VRRFHAGRNPRDHRSRENEAKVTVETTRAHLHMAGRYALMGREKEARSEAAEVLRIEPTFSAESYGRRLPYKDQKAKDDFVSALYKAGLK